MFHLRIFLALCLAFGASPLWAQSDMDTAFLDWAADQDMAPAAMVVLDPRGAISLQASADVAITTPMPVASISKTISGQCVLHMARVGLIDLDSPIGPHIGWDGPQGDVTFAQLLTHTSGFGPDATQRDMTGRLLGNSDRIAGLITTLATRPLANGIGTYVYNNENYLVLDAALSAVLGEPALPWCLTSTPALSALTSLGIAEDLNAISMAGGLAISTMDLATFFAGLPQVPPDDWPKVVLNASNSYGPGVIIQTIPQGTTLFHTGGICTMFGPNLGAFAARLASGDTIVMTYSGCADGDDLTLLNGFALELLRAE